MAADEGFKRKLAAILSADVEGYSRLMDDDEEATVRTITFYRSIITDLTQQFRGQVVDSPGDNILADFTSVVDAVNCAVEIQRDLAERNAELPDNRKMQFRIGVNLGDVIDEDGRLYGDGVNIAARVESLAEAGGICISGRAHDQVENKLGLEYEDLGKHEVKNISRPIQVYRVLSYPGAAAHRVVQAKESLGRKWRKIGLSVAAIVIVAIALGVWQFSQRRPSVEPASVEKMAYPLPEKPSIAVLPFENMSSDPEQEFFSDGLSEEIITALSSVPELFVIARNSTFTYKGKPVKVQQVSEELGVQFVLEGSVRKSGEKVRITAQLIDALKGHHLWAETYDRNIEDLFAVQEEITVKVITELRVKITGSEQIRFDAPCSENLKAYVKYLKALDRFSRRTKEDNTATQRLTEEAIALDPEYACAYSLLGGTHMFDVYYGSAKSPKQSLATAHKMVSKAIDINPSLAGPHGVLSHIYRTMGQFEKAMVTAEKGLALNSNSVIANGAMGYILSQIGKFEESIQYLEKVIRIDPFAISYFSSLGWSYFYSGQHEEAIRVCKRILDSKPNDFSTHLCLAATYSADGRKEEANTAASKILKMNPKFSLEKYSKSVARRYTKQTDREFLITNLRKAGLPDKPPLPLPDKPSIAVLAFDNMSSDPKQEYFSDGITEEIITALSKIRHLFVIARTSSFKYKGKDVDLRTVGRELGVRYVLEGSVRIAEDKVRITAQLIDAKTNNHIWAERFDREMKDIFNLQDEITIKIINALQVKLTEGEHARLWGKGTNNLETYLKSLRAREYYLTQTKEGNALAKRFAEEAIALDPEYPPSYHVLSVTHFYDVLFGTTKSPKQSMMKAVDLIQKAIALDDSYALAHGWLGFLYTLLGKSDKGIMEAQKGVALDPNGALNYLYLSVTLRFAGRHEESVQAIEKAIRLNPFPPVTYYRFACMAYVFTKRYEEAIAAGKQAVKVSSPNDYGTRAVLAVAYSLAGREEEAHSIAEEVLRINPKFSIQKGLRAAPYKNKADSDLIAKASRKAGLPE